MGRSAIANGVLIGWQEWKVVGLVSKEGYEEATSRYWANDGNGVNSKIENSISLSLPMGALQNDKSCD